jgi:hypothetical protein
VSRALPKRVHLPSGRVVRLDESAARRAANGALAPTPGLRARLVLRAAGVLGDAEGRALDADELALGDAHVLFALLAYADVLPEEAGEYTCESCAAPFRVAPSTRLEVGPFTAGELDDPELDAPFRFDENHEVGLLRAGGRAARTLRLAPRTLGEVLPLLRHPPDAPLRLTPAWVSAFGLVAIGRERRARALASALDDASDEVFGRVLDLWHEAHYPARLYAIHRCEVCGARSDLDVPQERELGRGERAEGGADGFPDVDTFEALVRRVAPGIYTRLGVRNVALVVDDGPPHVDEGGETLLGSYVPGRLEEHLVAPEQPEVRLYYRTFRAQYQDEPYDVEAEVRETLEHELTHHLHHLSGHDPMDDAERDEIVREEVRRVGKSETRRRVGQDIARDLLGFLRTTWPLWALLVAAALLGAYGD